MAKSSPTLPLDGALLGAIRSLLPLGEEPFSVRVNPETAKAHVACVSGLMMTFDYERVQKAAFNPPKSVEGRQVKGEEGRTMPKPAKAREKIQAFQERWDIAVGRFLEAENFAAAEGEAFIIECPGLVQYCGAPTVVRMRLLSADHTRVLRIDFCLWCALEMVESNENGHLLLDGDVEGCISLEEEIQTLLNVRPLRCQQRDQGENNAHS